MGWLISISGLDGAGKSTLIYALKQKFKSQGWPVRVMAVRLGFTPLILRIKRLAGVNESNMTSSETSAAPEKESLLKQVTRHLYRLAALVDLFGYSIWIAILRATGQHILTDRFYWDNQIIYQEKYGPPDWFSHTLLRLSRLIAGDPDFAFMLIIPVEDSYRRILRRNQGEEEEPIEKLERRNSLYQKLDEPDLIEVNAFQSPELVLASVWEQIDLK